MSEVKRETRLMVFGASEDRPVGDPDRISWPPPGMYDTTLGEPIFLAPGSYPANCGQLLRVRGRA
jgi:hypothetical protein